MNDYCWVCAKRKECKSSKELRDSCKDNSNYEICYSYIKCLHMGFYPWLDKEKILKFVGEQEMLEYMERFKGEMLELEEK